MGFHKRYIDDNQIIDLYREQGNQAVIDLYTKGVDAVITSGDLSEHILDILEIGLLTEIDKWNKISEIIARASIKKGHEE
jgi:extradiol dioxygenase family protein